MAAAVSFPEALQLHTSRDPRRIALVCGADVLTRDELEQRSNQVARALAAAGAQAERLVAIVLPNGLDAIVTVVASWKLGAVPLPLSHRMPAVELDAVLEVARPTSVVRSPIDAAGESDAPLAPVALLHWKAMATGGSTGVPKVVLDEAVPQVDPMDAQNFMRLDGTMLVAGPLSHSGPFINSVRGLLAGNTVVLMERFDPEQALALVERHKVDWTFLVPTMQHRIWRLGPAVRSRYDVSTLRAVVSSGGPFPVWLKAAMIEWLGADAIHEAYGGTEQIGGCAISGPEALRKPGSVGRVRPGYEMRITDDSGAAVAANEIGQVWFRALDGRARYRYVGRDDDATDWGSFGDLGWVDDDGYVFLADRRTDLIVTGGANVYPAEVEAALESHAAVRSSAVIGLPDDDLGHRVHALVDIADSLADEASVREHVAALVAPYKVPRTFEFVRESLRDEAGKVRRFALRAERMGGHQ